MRCRWQNGISHINPQQNGKFCIIWNNYVIYIFSTNERACWCWPAGRALYVKICGSMQIQVSVKKHAMKYYFEKEEEGKKYLSSRAKQEPCMRQNKHSTWYPVPEWGVENRKMLLNQDWNMHNSNSSQMIDGKELNISALFYINIANKMEASRWVK